MSGPVVDTGAIEGVLMAPFHMELPCGIPLPTWVSRLCTTEVGTVEPSDSM